MADSLDFGQVLYTVTQYLLGQNWQLLDPKELAEQIWQDASAQKPVGQDEVQWVQSQVWSRYAAALYDFCFKGAAEKHDHAWKELLSWLSRQALFLNPPAQDPDAVVQEALLALYKQIRDKPLRVPRTFLIYALQTLRNKHVDLARRQSAAKRGGEDALYLEGPGGDDLDDKDDRLEKIPADEDRQERITEKSVINQDIRTRLQAFFQEYLTTQLQQQVAGALFLDGLSPVEIAGLLGKSPHEVRMVKARIVQTLRDLPPDVRQSLLEFLDSSFGEGC